LEKDDEYQGRGGASSEDKRDAVIKEVQADYDKYLKAYEENKPRFMRHGGATGGKSSELKGTAGTNALEYKWASYLNDDGIHQISSLNAENQAPSSYSRPYVHKMKYYEGFSATSNLGSHTLSIYDRELARVHDSKKTMEKFIKR
jgi:hypothetical protein